MTRKTLRERDSAGAEASADKGYAMAALLVGMTIMAVLMSMALPAWKTMAQREKEDELVFRGQQYARAIVLFQRKYANTFPPNLDILLNEHYLRKKYKDPMTADGEFQLIYANQQQPNQPGGPGGAAGSTTAGVVPTQGQQVRPPSQQVGVGTAVGPQGGIIGVASKSMAQSIRIYNGHDHYNEWVFVAQQASNRAGAQNGTQTPTGGINLPGGAPGQRGGRGGPQPPGGFPGQGGRGNQPPNGRGQPPPFGQRGGFGGQQPGGFGAPGGNVPIGPGGVQLPGRGR